MGGRRRWGPLGWLAALLLGAFVLTSGFLSTQAQNGNLNITITWEPPEPFVGGDVTLTPGGSPNFLSCGWSRLHNGKDSSIFVYFPPPDSRQHPGPSYTGRETAGPKCALHIRDLTLEDSGIYVVSKEGEDFDPERGDVYITVNVRHVVNTDVNPENPDVNVTTSKGVMAGIAVGAVAGALLIGVLF